MRRALVVGIDHYERVPLATCVKDADMIADLLERNGDGSRNFGVKRVVSDQPITRSSLIADLKQLFGEPAEVALLYFSGHGVIDPDSGTGYLITPDCEADGNGVGLDEIARLAANEHSGAKATVVILDCCNSGGVADLAGMPVAVLARGMTILTSCDRHQRAGSDGENGVFTSIMIDALKGASADIRGAITPSSIYTHVDQALGPWDMQRPIYKANVREFVVLRTVAPQVPDEILRQFPEWFPSADHVFALDPSFEPDIKPGTETDYAPEIRQQNQAVFAQLQRCNRYGLIEPVGADHLYFAAMNSEGCRLTLLGAHYRRLALKKQI